MLMMQQRTIRRRVEIEGVGLHSGLRVRMALAPAAPDTGIVFHRTDVSPSVRIPARVDNVVDTSLATRIGALDGEGRLLKVGTVEHLMACLHGLGIDNVNVEIRGSEVPAVDGSSAPFVELVQDAGVKLQGKPRRMLVVRRPVEVREGEKMARIAPSRALRITCSIEFEHPLVRRQRADIEVTPETFVRELCSARTFGFLRDVQHLKAAGLARGGSLENAVVIGDATVLNEGGLRFPDELVRHKILDAMGDMALLGLPLVGHLTSIRAGHALNNQLARALLSDPRAFEVVELKPRNDGAYEIAIPACGLADAAA